MKKKNRSKRCYCMASLNKEGVCPHGCDPSLRAPRKRALMHTKATRPEKEKFLTHHEVKSSYHRVMPNRWLAESHEMMERALKRNPLNRAAAK